MAESQGPGERIEVSVPARPESLELVHPVLEQLWAVYDVPALDRMRFETAVVEIFANIVEHAFRSDPPDAPDGPDSPDAAVDGRRLELVVAVGPEELVATFTDNGLPVELDLSEVTLPDAEAESGRGLAMALAAVDELHYERRDGRNRWRLACRLAQG
jgi:serine/threonine-protein kinase RsbW